MSAISLMQGLRFVPILIYLSTAHEHHDVSILDIEVERSTQTAGCRLGRP
jgi:hypothetical protein